MSTSPPVEARTPPPPPGGPRPGRLVRWHHRVLGICFAIFALELGLFLLVFPWLRSWEMNWLPAQFPALRTIWINPYFRGALSGIGLLNLYVGFSEMGRQIRSLFS